MRYSKKEVSRRKFIQGISIGTIGVGLNYSALSASSTSSSNILFPSVSETIAGKNVRSQFMLQPGLSYFNTGSLGPSPKRVFDKVSEITRELELNPVGNNWGPIGNQANEVRNQLADYVNADAEEIILTRNTTEGMNLVASGLSLKEGDEIITSTDEHYGGQAGWEFFEKYHGVKIRRVEFPKENITTDQVIGFIKKQITSRTRVCSFMDVSTITGMRMPFKQLSEITKPKGILLVCDGAQSAGMLEVDVQKMGVDVFATSGHKWMLGPKETGFLYIKEEVKSRIKSIQLESGYKAYNHNTGTRNVANILGLGEAIKTQQSWGGITVIGEYNIALANHLRGKLKVIKRLQLITPDEKNLQSGITSLYVPNQDVKEIFEQLKQKNIVVKTLGKRNILRFSTHIFNTQEEVDHLVEQLSIFIK
ncbi:aminotransferase class V-fold PLP-dependent enzyme [Aquimarina sp. 2201CG5-10]|uniref:aminotransferase class V-fold PLP-dependent enzyme n=1 Tax=Aquimarina callyspongiae TaxID=3098150 RepID=UPI002AB3CBBB|nr:aminotransferase class V-fold PLP-dependent enzyme [Aquimarina sp. 2201CG5-10]MDY8134562.1 aminotransferase class V-fold PLP-dependent enzyme [Aquimarina sp. 2201CG5-10]